MCEPHICRCGKQVDSLGHHGLSCQRSEGRLSRHSHLNNIIKRSLHAAGVPARLEPVGLDKRDGRRPDGLTVFPFSNGKSLSWDATCSDTFSQTSIHQSAISPGSAADKAEARKRSFYSGLLSRYRFEPVSVETTGVYGKDSAKFVAEIGRRIRGQTGDKREGAWLKQRISIAIIRGNSEAVLGTNRAAFGT